MKFISIIIIFTSILFTACGDNTDADKKAFEAFLNLKRIPLNDKSRYERMLKEYEQREALASAITKIEKLDHDLIDAEINEFRKQVLISRYFESYLSEAVTDQGIENYYRENIEKYKSQKVHVAHILFRVTPRMTEVERQALLTTALDAYGKLQSGTDFYALAKEVSEDKTSAKKGGCLGWINQGAVSNEFSEKAFSAKAGEISEPFLTSFGFHIIKVLDEPQDVIKPLESVKGDIRYQLRNQSKKAEIEKLLNKH